MRGTLFKKSYGAKNNEVYNRHTTAKQPAETVEVSQDEKQNGTSSSSSMDTTTTSADKVTESSENTNTSGEEVEENAAPKNEGRCGLVSDARIEELKTRLKAKLTTKLNAGFDSEGFSLASSIMKYVHLLIFMNNVE